MRSIDCWRLRAAGGTGFFAKNARMSAARSIEQNPPSEPMMPGTPWNTPSCSVSCGQCDFTKAQVFFQEALRLDPSFPKARYNLGNAKLMDGDVAGALEDCEAAMRGVLAEDDRQMMRLARSTILMAQGRIAEGWEDYEARLHPQFNGSTHFSVEAPRWTPGARSRPSTSPRPTRSTSRAC